MSSLVFSVTVSAVVTMGVDDNDNQIITEFGIKDAVRNLFVEQIAAGDADCFDKCELIEVRGEV